VKGQEDFAGSDGDGVEQDGKKVQQPQLLSRTRSKKQTCYSSGCCDCYIAHIALTSVLLIANTWSNALTGISSCQYVHNVLQQKRFTGASRTRDKHILFQIHGVPPPKRMMRREGKKKRKKRIVIVQKLEHLLQGTLGQRICSKIKAQIHQKR
jgi:hypothetical protein